MGQKRQEAAVTQREAAVTQRAARAQPFRSAGHVVLCNNQGHVSDLLRLNKKWVRLTLSLICMIALLLIFSSNEKPSRHSGRPLIGAACCQSRQLSHCCYK